MYPTLFHVVRAAFGIDIPVLAYANTYGAIVLLAFLTANRVFAYELSRAERAGIITWQAPQGSRSNPRLLWLVIALSCAAFGWRLGALLGADPTADPNRVIRLFHATGSFLWMAVGLFVGTIAGGLVVRRQGQYRSNAAPAESRRWSAHTWNCTGVAAFWGFVGAKLLFLVEHPGSFGPSGYTMFGGLLLAGAMVMRYFKRNHLQFWPAVDAASLGVYAAYGVGRVACHVSGDGDWGVVNLRTLPAWLPNWLWAYDYPNNVARMTGFSEAGGYSGVPINSGDCFAGYCTRLKPGVYPTSLYEFLISTLAVMLLMSIRRYITTPGVMHGLFVSLLGAQRVVVDQFRVHQPWLIGRSQVQLIGVVMMVAGLLLVAVRRRGTSKGIRRAELPSVERVAARLPLAPCSRSEVGSGRGGLGA